MSRAILGEEFDIHGGGLDLIFPHHENEMAQSESCHGKPMARYWMHNGLMRASTVAGKVGGRGDREHAADSEATVETKISRSKGAGGLASLIQAQGGERIRFFLLRTHYRSTIVFGEDGLAEAGTALEAFHRLFERYQRITGESFYDITAPATRQAGEFAPGDDPLLQAVAERRTAFLMKMDDDFNSGAAMSELFELVRLLNKFADAERLEEPDARAADRVAAFRAAAGTMRELTSVLGLFLTPPRQESSQDDGLVDQLVQLLIDIRNSARQNKDFSTADRVRDELARIGITLEDRKGETGWRHA